MLARLKSFFNSIQFTLALAACYLFAVVLHFFRLNDQLSTADPFVIGEATKYGVSVAKRINHFYLVIFLGIIGIPILFSLLKRYAQSFFKQLHFSGFFQTILTTGIVLMIIGLILKTQFPSSQFMHAQILLLLLSEFINRRKIIDKQELIAVFLSGLSIFTLSHNIYITFSAQLVLISVLLFLKNKFIFKLLTFLSSGLSLFIISGVEITLILNQHQHYFSYFSVTSSLFVVLILFIILIKIVKKPLENLNYQLFAPLVLAGIAFSIIYNPVITQPAEMFELANKLNPLMLMSKYHELPMNDFISSHLFSDFFFETVYAVFNGYDGSLAPLIYMDFSFVLSLLLIYFFLYTVFGKQLPLLFFVFFSPVIGFFLPFTYATALVPAAFLYKFLNSGSSKNLYFTLISVFLVVFWRLDIGVSVIGGGIPVFILLFLKKPDLRSTLIKSLLVVLVPGGMLLAYYLVLKPDFFHQLLGYFGAGQAHGLHVLTYNESSIFYLNYYFLPIIIALIIIYLVSRIKTIEKQASFWLILFLCGMYLFNLQRGLTRHSFVENKEYVIASFGWLILLLFGWFYLLKQKNTGFLLFISSIPVIFLSLHGLADWKNLADIPKNFSLKLPDSKKPVHRVLPDPVYFQETYPLVQFLNDSLKNGQTFLDFSNTPLLYYYTQKKVPSIFCQYLQNTVSEAMQQANINELKTLDLPFVIFSQHPESYYDHTDDIPNEVRYFVMTEFIYKRYKPYRQIGKYDVWIKKNEPVKSELIPLADQWELGKIPYYQAAHLERKKAAKKNRRTPNDFVLVTIESSEESACRLLFENPELLTINFSVLPGKNEYALPIGASYHYFSSRKNFSFESNNQLKILNVQLISQ